MIQRRTWFSPLGSEQFRIIRVPGKHHRPLGGYPDFVFELHAVPRADLAGIALDGDHHVLLKLPVRHLGIRIARQGNVRRLVVHADAVHDHAVSLFAIGRGNGGQRATKSENATPGLMSSEQPRTKSYATR